LAGLSAGYLTFQLLDEKTDEMLPETNGFNAFVIGCGQGAISTAVGKMVFYLVG